MELSGLKRSHAVLDGFNIRFEGIDEAEVDSVLNTMYRSFNIISCCIKASKKNKGVL